MTTKTKPNKTAPKQSATGKGVPSAAYWSLLERFPLRPLTTAKDLDAAIAIIDELIDRPKLDAWEQAYLDVLADLVEAAEEEQHPIEAASDGETFAALCEEKGVIQQQAAVESGITNSTISSVVHGKRRFTRDHLRRLSEYFGTPASLFAE
ncbi:MAG: helix-turn-helix domain-containing protein [Planctomycetota bacterium]